MFPPTAVHRMHFVCDHFANSTAALMLIDRPSYANGHFRATSEPSRGGTVAYFSDVSMDATYLPRVSNRSKRIGRNVLLFVRVTSTTTSNSERRIFRTFVASRRGGVGRTRDGKRFFQHARRWELGQVSRHNQNETTKIRSRNHLGLLERMRSGGAFGGNRI